jgi:hypothetical protein
MSVQLAQQALDRARKALADHRKKQAAEEKRAADMDKAAAAKEASAQRASSTSMASNYLRDAQRKRADADKARAKAAQHSANVAKAQADVNKAEERLGKAKADEERKRAAQTKRDKDKREREEKRAKQETKRAAERAAAEQARHERERQLSDAARDQQMRELEAQLAATRATLESRPWENPGRQITVLFITAEPEGQVRLRIDKEIREIQERVRASELRDSIKFEYRPAARVTDLLQHFNEVEPDVVHFSGHGAQDGLAFQDDADELRVLTNEQLDAVVAAAPAPLKLAVFNSCNSAEQARVATRRLAAAVGMNRTIDDEDARIFAGQLYNALGFGRSLGLAFEQAKLQVVLTLGVMSGEPELFLADGVDPDELIIVEPVSDQGPE